MTSKYKKIIFVLGGLMILLAITSILPLPKIFAQTTSIKVSGWMWSDNVGWFNSNNITIDPASGYWSGYAWSDHIGWINFSSISVPISGGKVTGSAQACSVYASGCSGTLKSTSLLGGWDGKIEMTDVYWDKTNNKFTGNSSRTAIPFAWGDLNVGWLSLSGLSTDASASNVTLSVVKTSTDSSGVNSVTPINIGSSGTYSLTSPATAVTLTAKNSTGSSVATCWTGCGITYSSSNKQATYTCTMDASKIATVGCAIPTGDCGTDPSLCGCTGTSCSSVCTGTSCNCTGVSCDCDGTAVLPYTCSDIPSEEDNIQNVAITSGVNGIFKGISYSRTGDITYPTESYPFTVTITNSTGVAVTNKSLSFNWSGVSGFPTSCSLPTIAPVASNCSSGSTAVTVTSGGKYKLCFNQCLNTNNTGSRYNGTWYVPVLISGSNPTSVNGSGTNVKLYYSYASHQ